MTGRTSAIPLSEAGRARIAAAIRLAEQPTSGEIVVLVAARSGLYRSVGLALALVLSLIAPWPLIVLTELSAAWIALIQVAVAALALLATLSERVRLAFVPRSILRTRAHEAARREFLGRGLTQTRARSGVLIYVACAERYAEIVADSGVRASVPDATWHGSVERLLAAAGRDDLAEGLIGAVEEVGEILARALPGGPHEDELPNRVIVIE